jgi:hypothetical protein
VWIERFDCFPSTIELLRKTLKMDDKWKTCKQWSVEALACLCKYPSVIKFLAIHKKTINAYTLWWNGRTLRECWITTWNTPPLWIILPYCNKGGKYKRVNMTYNLYVKSCEVGMGINKYYECNTSLWNFAYRFVQGQHYVAFFAKQTRCCVHRHVQLGWS